MVGIFFVIDGEIIIDAAPVEKGKAAGDEIQFGNHYEFWKTFQPKTSIEHSFKLWPYDAFPRGKVVFIPEESVFRVYADRCLKLKHIGSVRKHFGVKDVAIVLDKQYQCAGCNTHFGKVNHQLS